MENVSSPLPGATPSWPAGRFGVLMSLARHPVVKTLALHTLVLVALYSAFYAFGVISYAPGNDNLMRWDAGIFNRLALNGYGKVDSYVNAYFPLFAYVWRFTGFSPVQITIFNVLCTYAGAASLAHHFRLTGRQLLLILSTPMMMFVLVPYAEGMFFLFGALLLSGLHRHKLLLTVVGLLGCCLTRSASTLFVPAYLFAELLWWTTAAATPRMLRNVGLGLLAMGLALGTVMLIQYQTHGDPLAFYNVHVVWAHWLRLPALPLVSTAGINVLWQDAFGLLLAVLATGLCFLLGLRWLAGWLRPAGEQDAPPSKAVVFSLGYCVGAGFFIVFYQGGDLVGIARYILATPCFGVLLWQFWQLSRPVAVRLLVAVVIIGLGIALALGIPFGFNSFTPGQAVWYFLLLLGYVVLHALSGKRLNIWYPEASALLYILNLVVLVYYHSLFLNIVWLN
ncbi:hypothetical protein [Hymenobacter algoricola]|uniref:Glycosyltransferase RgtA/B/C/D-like domain-containing protein n=1 Tax=Hymenobacter algoricola TaxID=486267 RepID=A0ABP7N4H2_9BACT